MRTVRVRKVTGTLMGTPNKEAQEYSRNLLEYKGPGFAVFLVYSWGSARNPKP